MPPRSATSNSPAAEGRPAKQAESAPPAVGNPPSSARGAGSRPTRRFRRSPTTASCRTATPVRWSPPTARSTGCASPTSTRRAYSARCSIAAPAAGALVLTACTCRAGRRYVPGTNLIETTWMTPQGWLRVVDGLTIGEWHDNKEGSSHTRAPTDFDADHLLVRVIECVQGEVQVEMVCEPMLQYGASPRSGAWRTPAPKAGTRSTRATADRVSPVQRRAHGDRGQPRACPPHDGRGRAALLRDLLDGGPGGPRTVEQADGTWSARAISGAGGWPKAPTRTIPGAITCSARHSR